MSPLPRGVPDGYPALRGQGRIHWLRRLNTADPRLKHVQVREYVRVAGPRPGAGSPRTVRARARAAVRRGPDDGATGHRRPGHRRACSSASPAAARSWPSPTSTCRRGSRRTPRRCERRGRTPGVAHPAARGARPPAPASPARCEVEEGHPIAHWQRLRTADGSPVCVSDVYISLEACPRVPRTLGAREPLRVARDPRADADLGRGLRRRRRGDRAEAQLLEIAAGAPVLRVVAARVLPRGRLRGVTHGLPRRPVHAVDPGAAGRVRALSTHTP